MALAAQGECQPVSVPAPEGGRRVGTFYIHLMDAMRTDPYLQDGTKRELMLRVWYPSAAGTLCRPAEYAPWRVWAYQAHLTGLSLPSIRSTSCLDAPVEPGKHPAILFSHGYTGTFTDSTFLFEDLASRGYIVISIAHTHETTAVEFLSGKLVTGVLGSYLDSGSLRIDEPSVRFARAVRLSDLQFLIDQLLRPSVGNGQLAARLKISVIGIMGHSLGGEVSLAALQRDSRLKAAVALDPPIGPEDLAGVSRAVLIMTAGRRKWSAQECHLWQNLRGPRLLINLTSADHFTFSDALWMFGSSSVLPDDPQAKKAIAFLRNSIGRFFDQHLKEGTASASHQAAHPQPGIAITTQYETLCAVPRANVQGGVQ